MWSYMANLYDVMSIGVFKLNMSSSHEWNTEYKIIYEQHICTHAHINICEIRSRKYKLKMFNICN